MDTWVEIVKNEQVIGYRRNDGLEIIGDTIKKLPDSWIEEKIILPTGVPNVEDFFCFNKIKARWTYNQSPGAQNVQLGRSIQEAIIPDNSITSISKGMFSQCYDLKNIYIGEGVTEMKGLFVDRNIDHPFRGVNPEQINMPTTLQNLDIGDPCRSLPDSKLNVTIHYNAQDPSDPTKTVINKFNLRLDGTDIQNILRTDAGIVFCNKHEYLRQDLRYGLGTSRTTTVKESHPSIAFSEQLNGQTLAYDKTSDKWVDDRVFQMIDYIQVDALLAHIASSRLNTMAEEVSAPTKKQALWAEKNAFGDRLVTFAKWQSELVAGKYNDCSQFEQLERDYEAMSREDSGDIKIMKGMWTTTEPEIVIQKYVANHLNISGGDEPLGIQEIKTCKNCNWYTGLFGGKEEMTMQLIKAIHAFQNTKDQLALLKTLSALGNEICQIMNNYMREYDAIAHANTK
jgi:hypothetical protein